MDQMFNLCKVLYYNYFALRTDRLSKLKSILDFLIFQKEKIFLLTSKTSFNLFLYKFLSSSKKVERIKNCKNL